jgi:hypothetical protein
VVWPFWMLMKIVYFRPVLDKSEKFFYTFSEILNSSLVILTIFCIKFGLF